MSGLGLGSIFKGIDKVGEIVDDNVLSQQEREEIFTRRLEIDANSDSPFAKAIRPFATALTGFVWAFILIASVFREVPPEAMYASTAAFMTCIGFYFDARRREKVSKRKALAAIKIEEKKLDQQKVQSRREARLERIRLRKEKKLDTSI